MPFYPTEDENGQHHYEITTSWEKSVADYCHISLLDVEHLDIIDYMRLRRDAFIYNLNQSEAGREYLANAYRLTCTSMDADALKEQFQN